MLIIPKLTSHMVWLKNLKANVFVYPGYLIQKTGAIVTGIGYGIHVMFKTEMGKKVEKAQEAMVQFKQQMEDFEKMVQGGGGGQQQMIKQAKKQESERLFDMVKGDDDDGSNNTH